jgi:hypothetical protein
MEKDERQWTPVLAFIHHVLGMKTGIFAQTSLKCSFSIQTLLRNPGISLFWKIKDLCASFSGKTLWQGYFSFHLQTKVFGLLRSKTS